jgi:solute carrier family 23 (nucleobase transporter), member 1
VPTLAILNLPQWKCPSDEIMSTLSADQKTELWEVRMRELSGAIAVGALVQVFIGKLYLLRNTFKLPLSFNLIIGYTGLVGKLLKVITPLTIVPTVSLVGLTLFEHAATTASKHWGIAVGLGILYTLFVK